MNDLPSTKGPFIKVLSRLCFSIFILSISQNVFAWCNSCGAGGCCRCPSGQAQCLGSHPSCEAACGLTTGGGGSTPSVPNSLEGALMQGLMQGIANGMQNQPPPRQMTPEEIEQARQAEIARQRAEQERQQKIKEFVEAEERVKKEREAQLDREAQDSLVLLNSGATPKSNALSDEDLIGPGKKNKDEKNSAGYQKGYAHASQCISRNAGPTCSAGSAEQTEACVAEYNAGYNAGDEKVRLAMKEAYDTGEATGGKGQLANGPADPRAVEGCRTQWIEAYNRGHFSGKSKHSK